MKCKCKAKPEPIVTWYRGQKEIKEITNKISIKVNKKQQEEDIYELILEIKDPGAQDGGTYRCHVKNEFGESNANLNLNIEAEPEPEGDGPIFVEKPKIISENNGKLVIMECRVKANPKPTILWTREQTIIKETQKIKIQMIEQNDVYHIKLELQDPQIEDSGLYKCNIKNNLGELNANLTLNIEIIPVIKEKPRLIKVIKKRTVIIECIVASKFQPVCTWFKENTIIRETQRHQVQIEQVREGEFAVKLEINQLKEEDKGAYKLVAQNEKGEATSQIVELNEIPPDEDKRVKPVITQKLTDLILDESKQLDLIISLKSIDKKVKVVWYKNSMAVKESSESTMVFDGTTARLSISNTRVEHSGSYRVVVSNELGQDESQARIIINKKEEKKKKLVEEKDEAEEKKKKQKLEEEKKEKEENEKKRKAEEEASSSKKKSPFDVKLKPAATQKKEQEVRISFIAASPFICFHFDFQFNEMN